MLNVLASHKGLGALICNSLDPYTRHQSKLQNCSHGTISVHLPAFTSPSPNYATIAVDYEQENSCSI